MGTGRWGEKHLSSLDFWRIIKTKNQTLIQKILFFKYSCILSILGWSVQVVLNNLNVKFLCNFSVYPHLGKLEPPPPTKILGGAMEWSGFFWRRAGPRGSSENVRVPQSVSNLLSSSGIIGYSGRSDLLTLSGSLIVMVWRPQTVDGGERASRRGG